MNYRGGYQNYQYDRGGGGVALPRLGSTVRALIFVTVGAFLFQFFLFHFRKFDLARYLGVFAHDVVEKLYIWQVVTYMLLHDTRGIFHILINMLLLYWFGTELEQMLGRRRFLTLYFGGGIAGGLAYCVTQYLAEARNPAIGASAAVMAVMVVFALHFPRRIILVFFIIPMQIKWFVLIYVGIEVLYSISSQPDGVAHTAHLGGAAFGLLYWRFGTAVARFFDHVEDRQRERHVRRLNADEQRMDDLLAKISREGFGSLSRRERKFLNEQSRRRRDQRLGR